MSQLDIRVLETSFRGYPRKTPCSWALHYKVTFACFSENIPAFLAEQLADVKGYFQIPQHFCLIGLWGQVERMDLRSDNEIGLGPRRVWHTHGRVNVTRSLLWDVWARAKVVYTFRHQNSPAWFKTDLAFRAVHAEDLKARWGENYFTRAFRPTTFCYSGRHSDFSMETSLTGRPDWSVAGFAGKCMPSARVPRPVRASDGPGDRVAQEIRAIPNTSGAPHQRL